MESKGENQMHAPKTMMSKALEISVAKLGILISVVAISCFCVGLALGVGKTQVYAVQTSAQASQNVMAEAPSQLWNLSGGGVQRPDADQEYASNWGVNGRAKLKKLCTILVNNGTITQANMDAVMSAKKKTDG